MVWCSTPGNKFVAVVPFIRASLGTSAVGQIISTHTTTDVVRMPILSGVKIRVLVIK